MAPPIEPESVSECNPESRQSAVATAACSGYPVRPAMENRPHPAAGRAHDGPPRAYPWADLDDDALLAVRICDLGLSLSGSPMEPRIQRLYDELSARDVAFQPRCYLTTEWLCPDRIPLVGIPFCLAHPRLTSLERSMMLEVEGDSPEACMQLLRHETGHAVNYAYRIFRRTRWRELFGPISLEYNVQDYSTRPYSRQFVDHLPDNYAQSHPDEDFAETFAVWLTPESDWRRRYRGWKAMQKLEYVDHVMRTVGCTPPPVTGGPELWPARRLRSTLRTYYRRKRQAIGEAYPGYYDRDLKRIFANNSQEPAPPAWRFLRANRGRLVTQIARGSRLRKYDIDVVLRRMTARARELNLTFHGEEAEVLLDVGVTITSMLCDYRTQSRTRGMP